MSDTRYGHVNRSGGGQDQAERKDEGWRSRQGGRQSRDPGRKGPPKRRDAGAERRTLPPAGTNTQGELAGIGDAAPERSTGAEDPRSMPPPGTDQPPRMGGPLGPDRNHPHLPEGEQNPESQGAGTGGFDRGVNATTVGAVHQGVKEEQAWLRARSVTRPRR